MGIEKVSINNFKSLKKVSISFADDGVTCLLGKNGSGKSSVMKAISYFYSIANNPNTIEKVIDNKNPFIQKASIEIVFDISLQSNNDIFKDSLKVYRDFITVNRKLVIGLTQYKNGLIEWSPINNVYAVKKILSVFPIYFIDAKEITADSWSNIWDIVSEIAISMYDDDDAKKTQIVDVFKNIYGDRFSKTYEKLLKALNEEKIDIKQNDYKAKYKNALISSLGGEQFIYDDEKFNYYSYGINSLKYLALYIRLLTELTDVSYKEVCLLIDEPEISLHPPYIDRLAEYFISKRKMQYMVVTHSPHFLANLLNYNRKATFYKIYNEEGYAQVEGYKFPFESAKWPIGDNETVPFFSNAVVFVEGTSEMQLFYNKALRTLFPVLEEVSFFSTNSDDSATRAILSKGKNKAIPYFVLVDMDKIIVYAESKKKFKQNNNNETVNPLKSEDINLREKFYYPGKFRTNTTNLRSKINIELERLYPVTQEEFIITDRNFDILIDNIKNYCLQYQVYPLKTTVEGLLINQNSYNAFMEWIKSDDSQKYNEVHNNLEAYSDAKKLCVLRCLYQGKLDILKKPFENKTKFVDDDTYDFITRYSIGTKTEWIDRYMSWIIREWLKEYNDDSDKKVKEIFKLFPELKDIVNLIAGMVKYRKYE
ncbi:Predicted ATP-dependent endonuclease of the OLD family, contains P-loop ATPase and TOPRIM domains [Pseudobutyrivibrio sp. NOR37]|uniref:retron Eco8 family effector endonuclease n=1 Tax=Pseudobutyrivibrio TaxID=46205 RepID=UPI0008E6184D|nr:MULTISPECIES: retron Eco8 family effector endonuclease [Pseudobutyrivibrio]SFR59854.1 Predicted ATP-dependent endonuclease of the OLD family, contains P-loop ATPase and TOPRIM domains [Pseudobutyrivibrio sp. NOR37]